MEILSLAKKAAIEAGKHIMNNFGQILSIDKKSDKTFVTNLDKEAETIIIDMIKEYYPSHSILGEESGQLESESDYLWVIDPIDGTHNFIQGLPTFGVSIGVFEQNKPIVGVVYLPYMENIYFAEKGKGAFKNVTSISVSKNTVLLDAFTTLSSSFKYFTTEHFSIVQKVSPRVHNIRVHGSSVINLALIAEGKLDILIEFFDKPWDYAGAWLIVEEAGGKITKLDGNTFSLGDTQYIATNSHVHEGIQKLIND